MKMIMKCFSKLNRERFFENIIFVLDYQWKCKIISINPETFCNCIFHSHLVYYPCHQNRGKIDDFIAIFIPINCALYRDSSRFRQKPVVNRDLIDDFFLENRDKIVRTDDFFEDENITTKSDRILIK